MKRTFLHHHRMPDLFLSLPIQTLKMLAFWLCDLQIVGYAQGAAPITNSGLNTQVSAPTTLPSDQTQHNITGGTRPRGGTNLFHSFGNFNVPTNNIANFFTETGLPTSNILGRVTDGNISNIFDTIQTTGFEPGSPIRRARR